MGPARNRFLREPLETAAPEIAAGSEQLRRKFGMRSTSPELADPVADQPSPGP